MTGGIQLRNFEGKPTEKLYGESGSLLWMHGTCYTTFMRALILAFFQILSKLKRMTLLTQKANVVTSPSKCLIWFI